MTRRRPLPPCLFHRKRTSQESCHIPRVHFHCVFSGTMRLGFTSHCEFTCDDASPCRMSFLFQGKRASQESPEVSKLEQRHMLTQEHCKWRHCWVLWLTPHKTRVTLLSKKLSVNLKKLPREDMICGNACVCIRRCDLWKRRVVNKHPQ